MLKTIAWVVAMLLVLGAAGIVATYLLFDAEMRGDVARLRAAAQPSGTTIAAGMLAGLPEPAQRYFAHAGVLGQPIPRIVRLTQRGRIRSGNAADWMAFEAEETYSTDPPAFVWRTWLPTRTMPVALGRDEYRDGEGSILIRMAALVPVADERGAEMQAAGLMRYLNEMTWFPAAFLGPNVTIAPADANSFSVSISDRGTTAAAVMFVDAAGRLTNFRAERFNTGTRTIETWETPLAAEGPLAGLTLPTAGSAVWKLPGGDLTYIELEVTGLAYEN